MAATVSKTVQTPLQFAAEHGNQIFVYMHLRTRQTLYSLKRTMSKDILKQLTFVGKKSVPATLRKDMWRPLCVMNFPNRFQGLHAYARLREFRERHETEWPIEELTVKKGPEHGKLMTRKERTFVLMDQKANSIADMAAVLKMQARPPDPELVEKIAKKVFTKTWIVPKTLPDGTKTKVAVEKPHWGRARRGQNSLIGHRVFEFEGNILGTSVWWADPNDAEYAEDWPVEVLHGQLLLGRNQPIWPPPAEVLEGSTIQSTPTQTGASDGGSHATAEKSSPASTVSSVAQQASLTAVQKIEAARQRAATGIQVTSHRVTAAAISSVPRATTPVAVSTEPKPEVKPVEKPTPAKRWNIFNRMYTNMLSSKGLQKKRQHLGLHKIKA